MDPDSTLCAIIDAAIGGQAEELVQRAQDLAEWLDKGGFKPHDPRVMDRLR